MNNTEFRQPGRVVIITGAGGALGGAVASAFAHAGWDLGLFEFGADGVARLRSEYPDAVVVDVNLTDDAATVAAVQQVLEAKGRVDALLGIAGGFAMSKALETSSADLDRMMNLNFRTLFNSLTAVLPTMRDQASGFVLGVSAGAALGGAAGMAPYATSKSAIATWLASLGQELKGSGIRVTTLYPLDALDTPANRKDMPGTNPDGWIDIGGLAELIRAVVESDPRAHVSELRVVSAR